MQCPNLWLVGMDRRVRVARRNDVNLFSTVVVLDFHFCFSSSSCMFMSGRKTCMAFMDASERAQFTLCDDVFSAIAVFCDDVFNAIVVLC